MRHVVRLALSMVLAAAVAACSGESDGRYEHDNGLIVEVLQPGTGPEIEVGQTAVMHYLGWLDAGRWTKGEAFDSSYYRGEPFLFADVGEGTVIAGWNQGIPPNGDAPGMRVGERRRLKIPADLAYGEAGAGSAIPPDTNLIFEVELMEIR